MARSRASDHDDKRRAILDRSAELFAAHGYDRASMSMISRACRVSKALLYHYYQDKEAILFDVIRDHLQELIETVEAADDRALPPVKRLGALAGALLEAYRNADAEHAVQINHLRLLAPERQAELRALELDLVMIFTDAVLGVRPELAGTAELKPVVMSLFGMLNWHYLWFRPEGALSREEYAQLATHLVVEGTRTLPLTVRDATARRRAAAGE